MYNMKMELENFRKIIIKALFVMGILLAVGCPLLQYADYHGMKNISMGEYQSSTDFSYSIEEIRSLNSDYGYIRGWVLLNGRDVNLYNTRLVLYEKNNDEARILPLKMQTRTDVTEHFGDGHNYDASGFEGRIDKEFLEQGDYYIGFLLAHDNGDILVKTGEAFEVEDGERN